jgi:hypothetical protein
MKLIVFLVVFGLLAVHFIISALAMMQAKRLKHITRTHKGVTWTYILATTVVSIGALATVMMIEY